MYENVIQSDFSEERELPLNVSFYSAVSLVEKVYVDIFPDLSENVQEKCFYNNWAWKVCAEIMLMQSI